MLYDATTSGSPIQLGLCRLGATLEVVCAARMLSCRPGADNEGRSRAGRSKVLPVSARMWARLLTGSGGSRDEVVRLTSMKMSLTWILARREWMRVVGNGVVLEWSLKLEGEEHAQQLSHA